MTKIGMKYGYEVELQINEGSQPMMKEQRRKSVLANIQKWTHRSLSHGAETINMNRTLFPAQESIC